MDVHVDIESYSEIDLPKVGVYRYAEHESTEILMLAYQIEDQPIVFHDLYAAEELPDELEYVLCNPENKLWAFNAQFERVMINEVLGLDIPIERWYCVMALANNLSFTGHMEGIVGQIGLDEFYQKDPRGKKLIHRFCKPQPESRKVSRWTPDNDPEGWQAFGEYNVQDVVAEHAIYQALIGCPQPTWEDYWLDQQINDRGIAIDIDFIDKAMARAEKNKLSLVKRLKKLTGLDNPNSIQQLREWLAENGLESATLTKAVVAEMLTIENLPADTREVLELRQKLGKISVKKLEAVHRSVCADGVLRGTLQFMGAARTHRWAGRILQPQNLPRPVVDQEKAVKAILAGRGSMDQLSSAIRGCIVGYEGASLGVADLAGIEGRVLPWLCGFDEKLAQIERGEDLYKIAAVAAGLASDVDSVSKADRQIGKVIILACGYQGAVGAFQQMATGYGLSLPDTTVKALVYAWREDNEPIVAFWNDLQAAATRAIRRPGEQFIVGEVTLAMHAGFLWIRLPSGNFLAYYQPEVDARDNLSCMGMNQYTRKWERLSTYGGKLAENVTQSVARDILMVWLRRMESAGYATVMHVHDEVIWEMNDISELEHAISLIEKGIDWAEGLPLNAEGFICDRYRK